MIPARGGSKRIKHKNIRLFDNIPLIAHSINTAMKSNCFDAIVVSTESDEIAAVAEQYGALVPFRRPKALADDFIGTTPIVQHALQALSELGANPTSCCCIYATAPLMSAEMLRQAKATLLADDTVDFVFSACEFSFPIQRALLTDSHGGVVPFDPESIGKRSQDLVKTYHDAGQFYWGMTNAFLAPQPAVFGPRSRMHLLPDYLVADIDTEADWRRAELLYRLLQQESA
ncbi:hypothetical protein HR45_15555 [Shewanella mangrovi]|uniref:NeuA n=1 Tax=Shewanella mangrovi TaxID=1515746 RepID=A0A094LN40_9GAMM|nr:hypothetical protein HR45_15555 [Shewanella mangrovi]